MAKRLFRPVIAASALLLATPARSATVEVFFTGEVLSVTDTHGVLDASVAAGAPLTGTLRYDSTLADASVDGSLGTYVQSVPSGSFTVELGSYSIAMPTFTLLVYDDFAFFGGADGFDWRLDPVVLPIPGEPGASFNSIVFSAFDPSGTLFADDSLPDAPIAFGAVTAPSFAMGGCLDAELDGSLCDPVQSIAIAGALTYIPEPPRLAAASVAAAALLLARSLRRA